MLNPKDKARNDDAKMQKTDVENIFSGDYSMDMWDSINSSQDVDQLRHALYHVCCRLQAFESRQNKRHASIGTIIDQKLIAFATVMRKTAEEFFGKAEDK